MSATGSGGVVDEEVRRAAAADELLVVSDFDGVLAPFVDDPAAAAPDPAAAAALVRLAGCAHTGVALVSGRARADLAARASTGDDVELIGSHGAEWEAGFVSAPDAEGTALLGRIVAALEEVAAGVDGAFVENKPASAVLHHRRVADPAESERVRAAALDGPATWPGVHVTAGKGVVEIAVVATNKGTAIRTLAERVEARTGTRPVVVFCGDDVTDERGFAVLTDADLGVKVGEGETAARLRVADIPAATALYERLADLRARHVADGDPRLA